MLLGSSGGVGDDTRMMGRRIIQWWRDQPLKMLWGLVILTAGVVPGLTRGTGKPGEFYPLSNFPMYSRFSASTYYVYVTDLTDEPVAVKWMTGKVLSNLKKQYDSELREMKKTLGGEARVETMALEQRVQAGEKVLKWLAPFAHEAALAELGGLRLKQVNITWQHGAIQKEILTVGEYRVP